MFPGILLDRKPQKIVATAKGDSMHPSVKNNQKIIFKEFCYQKIKIGDLILFKHPIIVNRIVIKRVSKITSDGAFFVLGDNPTFSTDSRTYGTVCSESIIGIRRGHVND